MKRIIFTIYNLNVGGVQKALLNILKNIDLKQYDISVLLYERKNALINELPKGIKVLYLSDYLDLKRKKNLFDRLEKNICIKKFMKKYQNILNEEYDVAIAFYGYDNNIDLVVPNIKAKKKIIWVHNDFYNVMKYSNLAIIYKIMFKFMGRKFKYFDNIAIVCEKVAENFNLLYKYKYQDKVKIINNYVDEEDIIKKSNDKSKYILDGKFNIISIGRLCKAKNFEMLINLHKKLIQNGKKVKTYIVGGGEKMKDLKAKIKEYKLEKSIVLLGNEQNPYSIIKQANLLVSTSIYESFGLTILESLVLGVPVVSTNTSGAENIKKNIALEGTCSIGETEKEIYELILDAINTSKQINPLKLKKYNKKVMDSIDQILT